MIFTVFSDEDVKSRNNNINDKDQRKTTRDKRTRDNINQDFVDYFQFLEVARLISMSL
jgi:hypothetical protein